MIAYHIDRDNLLMPGQIINLNKNIANPSFLEAQMFPDGVSYHGMHYLDESLENVGCNKPSYYALEYELELVRKIYFPHLPSRYQSFFALKSLEDTKQWDNVFDVPSTIWSIEFDESQCAACDSNLLYPSFARRDNQDIFFLKDSFRYYYDYWDGCQTQNPRIELLITPPVKILKRVLPGRISF